jgi:hypothetical protein
LKFATVLAGRTTALSCYCTLGSFARDGSPTAQPQIQPQQGRLKAIYPLAGRFSCCMLGPVIFGKILILKVLLGFGFGMIILALL